MGERLTERVLDRAHSAVIAMDERGSVTYWNPSAERIFGRPRTTALGRAVVDLIIPERHRAAHLAGLRHLLETGASKVLDRQIEVSALRADGSEFPVELAISALRDGDRWSFHAFIQDLSARVEAEREREQLVQELRRALHGSERRFDAIVGALGDAITIRDREHRFLYANRAAVAHLGFDTWEQLRDTAPASIMREYHVTGEDGREVKMEDIPSVKILRGESAEPLLIRTVNRTTGALRWNLLKAAPLLDEDGEVEATIMIIEEVTERKRAELASAFLARASAELATSMSYEQTLSNVAKLAVPDIADWCAVDLLDEDGDRRTVAVEHVDPERIGLAKALRTYVPDRLDPAHGLGRVLHTGESLLYPEISDAMLAQTAVDERHLELLRTVGLRSALIVPMRVGDRILGAMTLVSAESDRSFEQFDLNLAEQVAARAAVAIEHARLYSERSQIARTLQQSLLPEELPEIPGYELASVYLPVGETSMVGGDFYDVWAVGEDWIVLIGDVTGKGIEAAALTALVRHSVRSASEFEHSPAALLAFADKTLKRCPTLSVCTAMCLRLERERAMLAVGGHPLPLYVTADGVRELGEHGPLLGAFARARWQDVALELEVGATLVAYTDGVTDAQDENGSRFGLARLRATLTGLDGLPAAALAERLTSALDTFQVGAHADDTAAIVLRRLAPSEVGGREHLRAGRTRSQQRPREAPDPSGAVTQT